MVATKNEILKILDGYDKDNLAIATVCSHSSLQLFDGARKDSLAGLGKGGLGG